MGGREMADDAGTSEQARGGPSQAAPAEGRGRGRGRGRGGGRGQGRGRGRGAALLQEGEAPRPRPPARERTERIPKPPLTHCALCIHGIAAFLY